MILKLKNHKENLNKPLQMKTQQSKVLLGIVKDVIDKKTLSN